MEISTSKYQNILQGTFLTHVAGTAGDTSFYAQYILSGNTFRIARPGQGEQVIQTFDDVEFTEFKTASETYTKFKYVYAS